jgi:hypothetical protein
MGKLMYCFVLFAKVSSFEEFFPYQEASLVFYHKFCIYHVDALGHEVFFNFNLVVVTTITKFFKKDGNVLRM